MQKRVTIFLRHTACAAVFCLMGISSSASHLVGADLFYTHISDSTYKVTFVAYGDCGPASAAAFSTLPISAPQVCVFDGSTAVTSLALDVEAPNTGVEITPLCPGHDTSQCTFPSSTIPGIKKFVYSTTYTMPHRSSRWSFVYSGYNGIGATAGRAAAITNLVAASSTYVQLIATLDNTSVNNSNTELTVSQETYFNLSSSDYYTPGAVDPDADSIDITLVPAFNGTNACVSTGTSVTYSGFAWSSLPISATHPVAVVPDSFQLDRTTGQIYFVPDALQRDVIVYNIDEYRGGVYVGSSQREMTVLVMDLSTSFPCRVGHRYGSTLSTTDRATHTHFEVLPNPANNELTVSIDKGAFSSYTITNTTGSIVMQQNLTSLQTKVNISALQPGMYYLTVKGQSGTSTQKFVKI